MSEQDRIELSFSRRRLAVLIGIAVMTGCGLLAAGLFAGIEVGSVQARAAVPASIPEALPETALPLQYAHELPVLEAPETVAALTGQQQYVVQAASFRERGQAERLAADLTQRGYSAGVDGFADSAGGSWLIVRVGPYATRVEASRAASELGPIARSEPIVRAVDNTSGSGTL